MTYTLIAIPFDYYKVAVDMRLMFEIIPPPLKWEKSKVDDWANRVADFMKRTGLPVLNIPEVVDETRNGERTVPYTEKWSVEDFANKIRSIYSETTIVLNKITVRMSEIDFTNWFAKRVEEGYDTFLLVGGESSQKKYIGPSVLSAAEKLRKLFPKIKLGGITIFTRKKEADRIIDKMNAGIEFFVSQIMFETANMNQVIYELEGQVPSTQMPLIFASLAPATKLRDIAFMKWLGVEFPSAILSFLTEDENKIAERSLDVIRRLSREIVAMTKNRNIGINIEHIMYSNLEISQQLLEIIREEMKIAAIPDKRDFLTL